MTMDESTGQKSNAGLLFRTLAVFALAGPPVGGLSIIPVLLLMDSAEKGPVSRDGLPLNGPPSFDAIMEPVAAGVWIMALSYPFGLIPAVITGLVCGSIVQRTRSLPFSTAICSALVIAGLLVAVIIVLDRTSQGLSGPLLVHQALLMFAWPSLAAALVCTWIVRRRWLN